MNDSEKYIKITGQISFSYITFFMQVALAPFIIVLLTRTLTVAEYGVYTLISAFAMFATAFLELGFSQYNLTRLPGKQRKEMASSFFSIIVFEVIFLVAALLVFAVTPAARLFLKVNNLEKYFFEFMIGLGVVFFGTLAKLFDSYYKAREEMNFANTMEMFRNKGWALLLFAIFLISWGFGLAELMLVWIIGTFLCVLVYLVKSRHEITEFIRAGFSSAEVKKALVFSLPLMPVIITSWIIAMSNRYILNYYTSTATVGIFTLVYSLFSMINSFGATVSQTIQPYFAKAWSKKDHYNTLINASLKYGLLIIIPCAIGTLFLGKELITLLSGAKYLSGVSVIPVLVFMPPLAFAAFIFYQSLIAANRTRLVGSIHFAGAVICIILNFALIPRYGMYGAALGTVLSYLFMVVSMYVPARKYIRIDSGFIKIPQSLAAGIAAGVAAYLISPDTAILKLLTIAIGGLLYLGLIFGLKVFNERELGIIKGLLNKIIGRGIKL